MKKLISLFLTVIMALSLVPVAFAAEGASADKFTDVPADAWYRAELEYAVYNGYISGTSATTFSPDGLVTRGQFVTILGRMFGADTSKYVTTQFKDVDMSSWYGPYVEWARDKGIVNGISSAQFAPTNNITVEQVGVMLDNCIDKLGLTVNGNSVTYNDAASISRWAISSMQVMALLNLLPTDANGNVNPSSFATRAYSTVALVRLAKSSGIGKSPSGEQTTTTDDLVPPGVDILKDAEAFAEKIHDELWYSGEVKSSMTEKEKAIAYAKWMCVNCEYDSLGAYNRGEEDWLSHTAYSAFIRGYAVCDGLSKAYQLLLRTEGISCETKQTPQHMWVALTLDGLYYDPVDITAMVGYAKEPDGSFSQHWWELNLEKYFYPDAYNSRYVPD